LAFKKLPKSIPEALKKEAKITVKLEGILRRSTGSMKIQTSDRLLSFRALRLRSVQAPREIFPLSLFLPT